MKSFRRRLPLTFVAFVATIFAAGAAWAEERTVKGRVRDPGTGKGWAGASVGIKGPPLTATTQREGSFTLARAPDGALVLVVGAGGNASGEVPLPAGNDSARVMLTP